MQASDVAAETKEAVHGCMRSVDKDEEQQTALTPIIPSSHAPHLSPQHAPTHLWSLRQTLQEVFMFQRSDEVLSSEIKWKIKLWLKTILICRYQTNFRWCRGFFGPTSRRSGLKPSLVLCQQSCLGVVWMCTQISLHRCDTEAQIKSQAASEKPDSPVSERLSESLSWMKIRDNETITVTLMLHECELWLDWFPVVCETPAITSRCENRQQVWFPTLLINNKD